MRGILAQSVCQMANKFGKKRANSSLEVGLLIIREIE